MSQSAMDKVIRCPACHTYQVGSILEPGMKESDTPNHNKCRECQHEWPHVPGTIFAKHLPPEQCDVDGFKVDEDGYPADPFPDDDAPPAKKLWN